MWDVETTDFFDEWFAAQADVLKEDPACGDDHFIRARPAVGEAVCRHSERFQLFEHERITHTTSW